MLRYAPLIYLLFIICGILMISVQVLRLCKYTSTADTLGKFVFWHLPLRIVYETYFVLAIASWHNMLGKKADASKILAFLNIVAMFVFLGFMYYVFFMSKHISDPDIRIKYRKRRHYLRFI